MGYHSPELFTGVPAVDRRSDVFGAAVGWEFYSAFVPGGLDRGAALGLAVSRATASASAYALSAGGVGH